MSYFDLKAEADCLALQGICMCVAKPNLLSLAAVVEELKGDLKTW